MLQEVTCIATIFDTQAYLHESLDFFKETLNNSSASGQRIFSPIRAVPKTGNPYRIPPFSEPSAGEKPLAASSCRMIQSFLKVGILGLMNNLKVQAEEVILTELICA